MGQQGKRSTTGSGAGTYPESDGLSSLLEAERELTAELERADKEAAAIIDAARTKARDMAQEFEAGLAAQLRDVDAAQQAETAAAVSRTAEESRAHARRLDEVSEDRVNELAGVVLRDFLGISPASGTEG